MDKINFVYYFHSYQVFNVYYYRSGAGVLRPEKLRQKGIECVINATVEEPMYYGSGSDSKYLLIDL
jgi:hypothetical protein